MYQSTQHLRTHRHGRAVLGEPLEHVAAILHDRGHGAALHVGRFERQEIVDLHDGRSQDRLGRVRAEFDHHLLDQFGPLLALADDRHESLAVETVFHVKLLQPLVERQTHRIHGPCGGFGSQRAGRHGILVTHVIAGKVAERLFAAADVLGLALVLADDLGDILESREAVVALHLEMVGHGIGHLRGDDGLHDVLVPVQLAALGPAGQLVARRRHQRLVAVRQHVLALLVAQRDADTVGVRGR